MFAKNGMEFASIILLTGMGLGLIAWFFISKRKTPFTPVQYVFYLTDLAVARILWRAQVRGRIQLDPDQGAVIVCNHTSSLDPMLIYLGTHRIVHWMVAGEYFGNPVFGFLLRIIEVIPTRRGGIDTASTKRAIRYAQEGHLVGIFPEGRINFTDELLLPGRPGAAMIALKARVPVIPCFIADSPYDGTPLGALMMPAKVKVVFGEPIDLTEYYGRKKDDGLLQELTLRFLKEIARLADAPDFEPKLAGRRWLPEAKTD